LHVRAPNAEVSVRPIWEPPPPAPSPEAGAPEPQAESEPAPMLDAWQLAEAEDFATCRDSLKADGFKFQARPSRSTRDKEGCGIPHPVVLTRGPTGIAYDPPVMLDCSLARALGKVEAIVQEEAETNLHSKIVRAGNAGAFACRPRNFRKGASLSAHAFGTALDLTSFQPAKGTTVVIDRDYSKDGPRGVFLHGVYTRLRAHEADLTYVVGPDFNALHHNHFHLDRGGWAFWSSP
jgi:hypothetical protein